MMLMRRLSTGLSKILGLKLSGRGKRAVRLTSTFVIMSYFGEHEVSRNLREKSRKADFKRRLVLKNPLLVEEDLPALDGAR